MPSDPTQADGKGARVLLHSTLTKRNHERFLWHSSIVARCNHSLGRQLCERCHVHNAFLPRIPNKGFVVDLPALQNLQIKPSVKPCDC